MTYENNTLKYDLLRQYIIQLLLGNRDLRSANIEFFGQDNIKMAPYYDFGYYGYINPTRKTASSYKLHYGIETFCDYTHVEFDYFIKKGSVEEIEMFEEYLEKLKEVNLKEILKEIKEQTEKNIPKQIKEILLFEAESNLEDIELYLKRVNHK